MKAVFVVLLCVSAWPVLAQNPGTPGKFDHYVLALSWSPTYCAGRAGRQDSDQCGGGRPYGFVVHGLWPQYAENGYPVECSNAAGPDKTVIADTLPFMPSRKLIAHEWMRHGVCFGGSPAEYFAKARNAFAAVNIPEIFIAPKGPINMAREDVEDMFLKANAGLKPPQIAVVCRGRYAAEIRVCLTKDLNFTDCGKSVRDRCAGNVFFPPLR